MDGVHDADTPIRPPDPPVMALVSLDTARRGSLGEARFGERNLSSRDLNIEPEDHKIDFGAGHDKQQGKLEVRRARATFVWTRSSGARLPGRGATP